MKGMDVKAVAEFPGQFGQPGVYPGNINRDFGIIVRPGVEKRRHERDFVILAAKIERRVGLPGFPQGADDLNLLPELAGDRGGPLHPEAALDVGLDLRPQPEDEAPLRLGGQIPGGVGNRCGRTAKGNGNPRPR